MEFLTDANAWAALLTLTALEIVLGIDNIIFISILAGKVPVAQQEKARKLGLMGAFVSRLGLLSAIAWIVRLTTPLFSVGSIEITGRGLILILGGLFLIGKATHEIHDKLEAEDDLADDGKLEPRKAASMIAVVSQIMVIDIVFSLDSVITAVGMAESIWIMVAANVIALLVMLGASGPISRFVDKHPTIKVLALSFLVLIGTNLVAEGFGKEIPKGYTYFAMAFSFLVEIVNIRVRKKSVPRVHGLGKSPE